jgi:hypothetical protein
MEIDTACYSRPPGFTTGWFLFVGGGGGVRVAHFFSSVLCFFIWFVVVLSLVYSGLPILDLEKKS